MVLETTRIILWSVMQFLIQHNKHKGTMCFEENKTAHCHWRLETKKVTQLPWTIKAAASSAPLVAVWRLEASEAACTFCFCFMNWVRFKRTVQVCLSAKGMWIDELIWLTGWSSDNSPEVIWIEKDMGHVQVHAQVWRWTWQPAQVKS